MTRHPSLANLCMAPGPALPQRLRTAAQQLNGMLDAGEFARLRMDQLVDLRGLVWMLDAAATEADALHAAKRPQPPPAEPGRWWRRIWP